MPREVGQRAVFLALPLVPSICLWPWVPSLWPWSWD